MARFSREAQAERIARRQAQLPPAKEGAYFDQPTAKYVFTMLVSFVFVIHVVALVVLAVTNGH